MNQTKSNTNQNQFRAQTTMETEVQNSKFVGHSTEIIWQSKIKGPLTHSFVKNLTTQWTMQDMLVFCCGTIYC